MNQTNLGGIRRHAWVLGLAVMCAMPAAAQTTPSGSSTSTSGTPSTTIRQVDNNRDWGWIGLLGLVGLAGFFRKNDRNEASRPMSTSTR
ncbi:MAG: WGxxGxxG family protein [Burkholderiaceae bacterium]